jgi:hypothetical protein
MTILQTGQRRTMGQRSCSWSAKDTCTSSTRLQANPGPSSAMCNKNKGAALSRRDGPNELIDALSYELLHEQRVYCDLFTQVLNLAPIDINKVKELERAMKAHEEVKEKLELAETKGEAPRTKLAKAFQGIQTDCKHFANLFQHKTFDQSIANVNKRLELANEMAKRVVVYGSPAHQLGQ